MDRFLVCSTCSKNIKNTPEENTDYGQIPHLHNEEFGTCIECGGDQTTDMSNPTETQWRKRYGKNLCTFYDMLIPIVENYLSEPYATKFHTMPYYKKCMVIVYSIERGLMT